MTSASTPSNTLRRVWARGGWFVPAAFLIAVMRWRYLFTPITADEGGYLAEARAWGRGAVLYRDVWVDRPQGLMLLFRIWNDIGLGSPVGVRLLALAACLVGAVAGGCIAKRLVGGQSAWMAALAIGVLASVPQYEGFIANAELLSSAVGVLALAVLLRAFWDRDAPSLWGLGLAGVVAGCAISVKQSGFDAFAAGAIVVIAVAAAGGRWARRDRVLAVPAVVGGVLVPVGLMALHGAITGWHRWWFAFAGYRLEQRSALKNAEWDRYHTTAHLAMPILWPAIIGCALAIVWAVRRAQLRASVLLALWSLLAVVAFLMGGQFFRHYWVIFAFPLGTACGSFASLLRPRVARYALLLAMTIIPVVAMFNTLSIPRDEVGARLSDDVRLTKAEKIGEWFEDHKRPGENVIALCAGAPLYGNVSTDPPYPYLWFALIPQVPGAHDKLVALMTGPKAPTYVASFQPARLCDSSGALQKALDTRYRAVDTVLGIVIYRLS